MLQHRELRSSTNGPFEAAVPDSGLPEARVNQCGNDGRVALDPRELDCSLHRAGRIQVPNGSDSCPSCQGRRNAGEQCRNPESKGQDQGWLLLSDLAQQEAPAMFHELPIRCTRKGARSTRPGTQTHVEVREEAVRRIDRCIGQEWDQIAPCGHRYRLPTELLRSTETCLRMKIMAQDHDTMHRKRWQSRSLSGAPKAQSTWKEAEAGQRLGNRNHSRGIT